MVAAAQPPEKKIIQYTIYKQPKDFPDECVARRAEIGPGVVKHCEIVARGKTVEEVREQLPKNITALPVFENDDPVIVEVWWEV
jgi:hypothetical protein